MKMSVLTNWLACCEPLAHQLHCQCAQLCVYNMAKALPIKVVLQSMENTVAHTYHSIHTGLLSTVSGGGSLIIQPPSGAR